MVKPNISPLSCHRITKSYQIANSSIHVLRGIDLSLNQENSIAIVGASGCGKSTLLHLLAGLEKPTSGEIKIEGISLHTLNHREQDIIRNRTLGFVYQFNHLLPEFTAEENVAMPLLIRRMKMSEAIDRARRVLVRAGLERRFTHKPSQMSGGERQRTAIARAVIGHPACVLADEPTGNLDRETAAGVQTLLFDLNREEGTRLVLVTHDIDLAKQTDQVFELRNGILEKL